MKPDEVRRLRIAVVTRHFATHGGGAERYAVAVAEALATRHEVHVFAQTLEHDHPGIQAHRVPLLRKPRWLNQWLFARRVNRLTAQGFDVVHAHENGVRADVQTVHVRPMRYSLLGGKQGWQRAKVWLKILTSVRLLTYLRLEARRFICPGSAVVAVSAPLADEVRAAYPQAAPCMQVIPPGVDRPHHVPERSLARQALGLPRDALCALFVANDFRRKGLDTLLQVLASSAHDETLHLAIVGESPAQSEHYRRLCRQLGIEARVHFLGRQSAMTAAYAAADVLVHPTREDTFGMVVLEAMAHGLPVIVSRAPFCGLSAELTPEQAVLLNDPTNVRELAAALHTLHDATLRAALSATGRRFAAAYTWDAVAAAYERLYLRLAGEV